MPRKKSGSAGSAAGKGSPNKSGPARPASAKGTSKGKGPAGGKGQPKKRSPAVGNFIPTKNGPGAKGTETTSKGTGNGTDKGTGKGTGNGTDKGTGKGTATGPEFIVVLVGPKYSGNVGLIARLMKNFGFNELRIVGGTPLTHQAWRRAMKGREILDRARIFKDFDEALSDVDYIAGTSGICTENDARHNRAAITPHRFAKDIRRISGKVAVLFGREDFGLLNPELAKCDVLVSIPAAPEYPIMNISHAAAVLLYEINLAGASPYKPKKASGFEKNVLFKTFHEYLEFIDWPTHKREKTEILFRRIMGRAVLSEWEFFTMMGLFQRAMNKAHHAERQSP